MNYRKLRHELTDTVAVWLHYIENVGKVDYWSDTQPDSNKTASEVISEQTGGVYIGTEPMHCFTQKSIAWWPDCYPSSKTTTHP